MGNVDPEGTLPALAAGRHLAHEHRGRRRGDLLRRGHPDRTARAHAARPPSGGAWHWELTGSLIIDYGGRFALGLGASLFHGKAMQLGT